MKKVYLFVAAAFLSVTAFGQSYDIETALVSPASMSTVEANAAQVVDFTITNNGPDALPSGSTLWLCYMHINPVTQTQDIFALDGTPETVNGFEMPSDIPAGTPLPASAFGGLTINTTVFAEGDIVAVWALGLGEDPNTIAAGDPNDTNNDNNLDGFVIGAGGNVGVAEFANFEVSVYPNPVVSTVNFKVDGLDNGTILISSITGQQVANVTINGEAQVDVTNYNNGVYVYSILDNNGKIVTVNKFVVQK